ncbi:hypothetical protein F2Q69_00008752 [Brassica cretica]|uniref:RNase H type-1 domain-containing protein n=1 Tax=Brassica cretica TaxID=69181 RepID=A0A8S9NZ92_BRACR|nr:hypothetical protein F2Q69_00008752 [Brassica cretica]
MSRKKLQRKERRESEHHQRRIRWGCTNRDVKWMHLGRHPILLSVGGFVMDQEDESSISGSFGRNQVLYPLHAEFQALLSAMGNSLRMGHESMHFESDSLQIVKLIEEEEFWPALASELDEFFHLRSFFTLFSLSFIYRDFNSRADLLAKGARAKGYEFSHVNTLVPPGLAQTNPLEPA